MKLAVSTYSLSRWRRENKKSLEQSLRWMAASGVKAVEFAGLDDHAIPDPVARAKQLRRRCDDLGLKVISYCVGAELLVGPRQQKQVVRDLKRQVDVAAALGVSSMRHDVTRGPTNGRVISLGSVLESLVDPIREVAAYAQRKDIKTSLENHGFYMQPSRTVERLIKSVAHPNFALTLDMGNFLCVNEDPVSAVARLARYAVMVHVKDFHVRPKSRMPATGWFATPTSIALRGAIVGHGQIDIPAQLKLLKKAGYAGYLSLEFEGMEEPAEAIRLGLDYLRQQLGMDGR